jgi:hypothetical protein
MNDLIAFCNYCIDRANRSGPYQSIETTPSASSPRNADRASSPVPNTPLSLSPSWLRPTSPDYHRPRTARLSMTIESPVYRPKSPLCGFSPTSPGFGPRGYSVPSPTSPTFSPSQVARSTTIWSNLYSPESSVYPPWSPTSPPWSPASPPWSPASPPWSPTSPPWSPTSPPWSPTSPPGPAPRTASGVASKPTARSPTPVHMAGPVYPGRRLPSITSSEGDEPRSPLRLTIPSSSRRNRVRSPSSPISPDFDRSPSTPKSPDWPIPTTQADRDRFRGSVSPKSPDWASIYPQSSRNRVHSLSSPQSPDFTTPAPESSRKRDRSASAEPREPRKRARKSPVPVATYPNTIPVWGIRTRLHNRAPQPEPVPAPAQEIATPQNTSNIIRVFRGKDGEWAPLPGDVERCQQLSQESATARIYFGEKEPAPTSIRNADHWNCLERFRRRRLDSRQKTPPRLTWGFATSGGRAFR